MNETTSYDNTIDGKRYAAVSQNPPCHRHHCHVPMVTEAATPPTTIYHHAILQFNYMREEQQRPWRPLAPQDIPPILEKAPFPWWIAGGYAIEHAVGHALREHGDLDILLLRKDHAAVRELLADWDCWVADPPGALRPWHTGETLSSHIHDIWCSRSPNDPWQFQIMLDEGDDTTWYSRRCSLVTKPLVELTSLSTDNVPFLVPETQLFYKAKAPCRKDEVDFAASLPVLSVSQKIWLANAIKTAYGPQNAWLEKLPHKRGAP